MKRHLPKIYAASLATLGFVVGAAGGYMVTAKLWLWLTPDPGWGPRFDMILPVLFGSLACALLLPYLIMRLMRHRISADLSRVEINKAHAYFCLLTPLLLITYYFLAARLIQLIEPASYNWKYNAIITIGGLFYMPFIAYLLALRLPAFRQTKDAP